MPKKKKPTPAAIETPPPVAEFGDDNPRFWQLALVLLLCGIALRQMGLARAPYSSDEAIHAWFSAGFRDYVFDPVYHGPLLYHLLAAVFSVIKPHAAGDFAGRMVPSLLGIGLLALTIGPARKWLGHKGALWCLAMLAISPVMVAYHRVLIHDALVMLLTLGAILCFQKSLETHSWTASGRQARIGLVALLTLFLCTKANAFFIIAMLCAFWCMAALRRKISPPTLKPWLARWLPLAMFLIMAVASHIALRDADLKDFCEWLKNYQHADEPYLNLMRIVHGERLFKIASLLAVAALGLWILFSPTAVPRDEPTESEAATRPRRDIRTPALAGWAGVFLFAYFYGHGVAWWQSPVAMVTNTHLWLHKSRVSQVAIGRAASGNYRFAPPAAEKDWTSPHLNEAPDWDSVTMAVPRMLSYWGGQQKTPRLPGPHDYYLPLMLLYELPIVLLALGGIAHAARRRTPFGDLLLWWAFTSFVLYAVANEKVPWLLTHIMLPLILLAGMWLGAVEWKGRRRTALIAFCAFGLIFLGRNVLATAFGRPNDQHEPLFYAQTTEAFRDKFEAALRETSDQNGDVWVDLANQWPPVWYLRVGAPLKGTSEMALADKIPAKPCRVAITSVETWEKFKKDLPGWRAEKVDFFIWPRASWKALRPANYWNFWAHRKVNPDYKNPKYREWLPDGTIKDDSVLGPPGEWSYSEVVVAVK